jgi:hypothetical protein
VGEVEFMMEPWSRDERSRAIGNDP